MSPLRIKIEWFLILLAHLVLLGWIFWVLDSSGKWEQSKIWWHFFGLSVYGGLLIRFCAWIYMRRFKKEQAHDLAD